VAFRAHTRELARRLGLTGHAKNLPDGSVEVLACGDAAALDELESWLRRGPPAARVDAVTRTPGEMPPPASFTTA
jgi:acylphosphatase